MSLLTENNKVDCNRAVDPSFARNLEKDQIRPGTNAGRSNVKRLRRAPKREKTSPPLFGGRRIFRRFGWKAA